MTNFSILIYIIPDLLLFPSRNPLHLPVWIETCLPMSILIYSLPLHWSRYFSPSLWHQQSWWSFRANHFHFRLKYIYTEEHTHGDEFVKKSQSIVPWIENRSVIIEKSGRLIKWRKKHTIGTIPKSTRYDYNLTIMESPKPATGNRFKK